MYVCLPFCYSYVVSVAIMQLEVSAAHMQVTVSAGNIQVTIFVVIMQMVFSAVHYARDCFHCYYAGDSDVGDSL